MHKKTMLKCGTSLLLASSLAACGGGGGGNDGTPPTTVTPTPTTSSFQSKLGSAFAGIFDAGVTTDPANPTDASVPALAPTSDPVNDG